MEILKKSFFKDEVNDTKWFGNWVSEIETLNKRKYRKLQLNTSLGKTIVYELNEGAENSETLVIFPGARTSALFWDLDRGLDNLGKNLKIFLVETNGLPNLSDGNTPDIKSDGYGEWAEELFTELKIKKAFVAGASFGGLICMKLAIKNPEKIKAAFLFNPGCLQSFSLSAKNLYYNLLPIISPTRKNVIKFLDKAVFSKPNHQLSEDGERLLIDYEVFALKRYKDNTQKPYYMGEELKKVKVPVYLVEGDRDLLFPFAKSIENAKMHLDNLKEIKVFENVGHGIETYDKALTYVGNIIKSSSKN